MSTIFAFIGVDGGGIYEYFDYVSKKYKNSYVRINGDLIKADFPNNGSYRSKDNAFRTIRRTILEAVSEGKDILFYDSENITLEYRRRLFGNGADVVAVYFDIPLEKCLENNQKHERYINEDRIYSDYYNLVPPRQQENFSYIFHIKQETVDKLLMLAYKL